MEKPADRWNMSTFLNSCKYTFLIGIVPFAFFTIINYRYLLVTDIMQDYNQGINPSQEEHPEELVHIISTLKKEELSFYPSQFYYAESDGNYVVFNITIEGQIRKKIIRNSISNLEQQLSAIPFFMRTHRAFIVNLNKVCSKKGNTLGYKLKLSDISGEIPVSRQTTRSFDQIIDQYK
jgi:DNA-binding LytR/AlgR family response regulator